MATAFAARAPRFRIHSFPCDTRRKSIYSLGSAHVSVELQSNEERVFIRADCTIPPWEDREMAYCGQQSSGKFLYTMLYEHVPLGPVHFRMRAGDEEIVEHNFYERVRDADGNMCHVVESWEFPSIETLTPTPDEDENVLESLRSPLFEHEKTRSRKPWERHRRSRAVSFPAPPTPPQDWPLGVVHEEDSRSVTFGEVDWVQVDGATGNTRDHGTKRKDSVM